MSDSVTKYFENQEDMTKIIDNNNGWTITPHKQPIDKVLWYSNTTFPDKKDKYVQQVKEKFEERSQIGIKKYNTTLERTDLDLQAWLTHLQEELMDATLYIERLKDEVGN